MKHLLLSLLALLSLARADSARAEWLERVEDGIMGTRIVVELWATDKAQGNAAIEAVLAEMRRVDEAMSTYKPTSELSIVNARAAQEPIKISAELFELLSTAVEYSRITDGAFDITYASVGYLYDFRKHVRPDEKQIAAALPGINYRHLLVGPQEQHRAFRTRRHAHRSGWHRQRSRRRSRHRDPASTRR